MLLQNNLLLYLLTHQINLRLFLRWSSSQGTDFHFKTQMPELSIFSCTSDTLLMMNSLKRLSATLKSWREIVLERGRKQRTLLSLQTRYFSRSEMRIGSCKEKQSHLGSTSFLVSELAVRKACNTDVMTF